jgi:hypothetical protein
MKKDDIEDIYGELKTYSKEPPKELWDNIEARLLPKKKRRGIFWFWGSAAAILIVFVGYMFTNSAENNKPIKEISDVEHSMDTIEANSVESQPIKVVEELITNETTKDSFDAITNEAKNLLQQSTSKGQLVNSDFSDKHNKNKHTEKLIKQQKEGNFNKTTEKPNVVEDYAQNIAKDKSLKRNIKDAVNLKSDNKSIIDNVKETAIAVNDSISKAKADVELDIAKELMAENNNESDTLSVKAAHAAKWSVEVLGGLSNTVSDASLQGASINTTAQNDFVYAFKVGYAVLDRLIVKTGIGKNSLGQEINNIAYASASVGLGNSFSTENSLNIVNDESVLFFGSPEFADTLSSPDEITENGTLQQQLNYIQVPLEISYKIISKNRFGVALGFGGNVNFIAKNKAYLNDEEIGENLGVSSTVFGALINSNLSYNLTKKAILFVEPSYNYFQKPIDTKVQDFKNTQFRLLFGLQFKL